MKISMYLIIGCVCALTACGPDNSGSVREDARQSLGVENRTVTPPVGATPSTPVPPSNQITPTSTSVAGGVQHYTCPNNCEGSGGDAQVACPVCGTQYVHNAAYHNQTPTQTNPAVTQTNQITPPTPEPPQNAAGVWHYTCSSGCEGGAGSAVACASCGTTLAHNTAYHAN